MSGNYFIDTHKFPIDKFREMLRTKDILPGRILLKEKIDERFDLLKSRGIHTIHHLLEALKTKQKIDKFSRETGLSADYLTILRREANSYIPVPVKLTDLPFAETDIINILESDGIKDSRQFFDIAAKIKDRALLSEKYRLPVDKLTELVQLCDLVRITGVGPVFTRIIFDSGIRSVRDFLASEPKNLFEQFVRTNNEKGFTKAKFTVKDIEYCIELGSALPIIVES